MVWSLAENSPHSHATGCFVVISTVARNFEPGVGESIESLWKRKANPVHFLYRLAKCPYSVYGTGCNKMLGSFIEIVLVNFQLQQNLAFISEFALFFVKWYASMSRAIANLLGHVLYIIHDIHFKPENTFLRSDRGALEL